MIPTADTIMDEVYRQWLKPQVAYVRMSPNIITTQSDLAIPFQEASVLKGVESWLNRASFNGFSIPRAGEVCSYLIDHPDMLTAVNNACDMAKGFFDSATPLSLEVYVDPEIDDRYLTLYVQQEEPDDLTWEKVERIRKSYENKVTGLSGWLHITVDFRS